jgi:hypothetical protein
VLNTIESRVRVELCAVGEAAGIVRMTSSAGTVNRVLEDPTASSDAVSIPVRTLDEVVGSDPVPQIMKMDIEGYELPALRGATRLLSSPALRACIIEVWTSSHEDSHRGKSVLALMEEFGFRTAAYDGFARTLRPSRGINRDGNTLFVRDWDWTAARVRTAPAFVVLDQRV